MFYNLKLEVSEKLPEG